MNASCPVHITAFRLLDLVFRPVGGIPRHVAMAGVIRRPGVPVVDSSGSLSEARFPRIRSDEETVGRMAAEHLCWGADSRFTRSAHSTARIGLTCVEPSSILVKPIGVMARQSTDVLAIDDRHIAAALKRIHEHACDGLEVESILKAVPLFRSVPERRFSQILGNSPKAEILRVRLDRVCRLLVESDLSLAEVAEITGFEHPEYMSPLFKKKMGDTPGEFRRFPGSTGFPVR